MFTKQASQKLLHALELNLAVWIQVAGEHGGLADDGRENHDLPMDRPNLKEWANKPEVFLRGGVACRARLSHGNDDVALTFELQGACHLRTEFGQDDPARGRG